MTYTDGYALVTQLAFTANPGNWPAVASAGMCVSQKTDFASCWSVSTIMATANGYTANKGYLVP